MISVITLILKWKTRERFLLDLGRMFQNISLFYMHSPFFFYFCLFFFIKLHYWRKDKNKEINGMFSLPLLMLMCCIHLNGLPRNWFNELSCVWQVYKRYQTVGMTDAHFVEDALFLKISSCTAENCCQKSTKGHLTYSFAFILGCTKHRGSPAIHKWINRHRKLSLSLEHQLSSLPSGGVGHETLYSHWEQR